MQDLDGSGYASMLLGQGEVDDASDSAAIQGPTTLSSGPSGLPLVSQLRDLDSFIAPVARSEFLASYWGRRPLVQRGASSRVASIIERLPSLAVNEILQSVKGSVRVTYETQGGEYRAFLTSPREAWNLYEAGMSIFIADVPSLAPIGDAFAKALGIPRGAMTCPLFASPAGSGARCHFDRNEVFTIQLKGAKTWRFAANEHALEPISNWVTSMPLDDELRLVTPAHMPQAMPRSAKSVTLEPGTAFYLPRGYWHETKAESESISMSISCAPPTWGELLLPAIRTVLLSRPDWRRTANGAFGARPQRAAAAKQLARLCAGLGDELADIDPRALLDALPEGRGGKFRRNALASFGIDALSASGEASVTFIARRAHAVRRSKVRLAPELVDACLWIGAQEAKRSFSARTIARHVAGVSAPEAAELLTVLRDVELVLNA